MKKKIAVFGNGWSNEYLSMVMDGIHRYAETENADVFLYMNYASYNDGPENNTGEFNIFNLPKLESFDGIIVLGNTINSAEQTEYLRTKIINSGTPAISFESELEGLEFIGTENYGGMYELTTHLINCHHCKNIIFVSGPADNAEARERLVAVTGAMQRYGLSLPPENIIYCDWSYVGGMSKAKGFCSSGREFPDAFICANDHMAVGMCTELSSHGIEVPRDIIVTGFDHIGSSRNFYPSITSVDREWESLGYRGCLHLFDQIKKKPHATKEFLNTKLAIEESCGCAKKSNYEELRAAFCRNSLKEEMNEIIFDATLNNIEQNLFRANTVVEMAEIAKYHFQYQHSFEGQSLYIMLDPAYEEGIYHNEIPLRTIGYSDNPFVLVSMENSKPLSMEIFDSLQIVPNYDESYIGSRTFILLPLHYQKWSFGYVIFCEKISMLEDRRLQPWLTHFNQLLERFRQSRRLDIVNRQLLELSTRDPLTGLFNRFGQDYVAIPLFTELQARHTMGVILFADINKMKFINDNFGHLQGDLAIRAVADSIRKQIPEEWIAIRFGGDEYLVFGEYNESEPVEYIINNITGCLAGQVEKMALPFPLTVSMGFIYTDPDSDLSFAEYTRLADEKMYVMKQEYHKLND